MKVNKGKLILALIIGGILYAVAVQFGLAPGLKRQASAVPSQFALNDNIRADQAADVTAIALPSTKPCAPKGTTFTFNVWEWNAQMGFFFANGGPVTTCGSLMEKHGINVKIERQDDTTKMQASQVKFAQALADGDVNAPNLGVQYVIIMGDQLAGYLASINKLLEKLGPEYVAETIGAVGRSAGEDAWWGPQEWRDDLNAMKGEATVSVIREGDWNIVQFKLANDGIKNNPDCSTWDPDAHNCFAADTYLSAVQMLVANTCETRPEVRNGTLTGKKHEVCAKGVATWTPGDVNLARAKGGLVRLLSTKENINQMPAVIVGIRKWNIGNSKRVSEMLAAIFEGSDQVRTFEPALQRAGQASYAIYADQTPAYWVKYYKGVIERDRMQQPVPLGGSEVLNFADNLVLFGMNDGGPGIAASPFSATYTGFGNIVKQQYPKLLPSFPPVEQAVNVSMLESLKGKLNQTNAATAEFDTPADVTASSTVASRTWNIQFKSGSAEFDMRATRALNELYEQLLIGGNLTVRIEGHTDNVGSDALNQDLSNRRAAAVYEWLHDFNPKAFPENRFQILGFGSSKPVASNDSPEGREKNRRVVIALGAKQ